MHHSNQDKNLLSDIRDIFNLFNKTFSQMKIFSQDHENVRNFTDQLYQKFKEFLDLHWKMEITIDEFSFYHEDTPFFTQNQMSKSLPFFFYKDGMKKLFFYKGLLRDEFFDFLDLLIKESSLPPEESDIVSAMWERDFNHIRYFAPDEFLESKIGAGMEIPDYQVDKETLYSGTFKLMPSDQKELDKAAAYLNDHNRAFSAEMGDDPINEEERLRLEALLQKERRCSEEDDFFSLLVEMLYLEKDPEKLSFPLNIMLSYLNKHKNAGDFKSSLNCIGEIQEFRSSLSENDPRRKPVARIFSPDRISVPLALGKSLVDKNQIQDLDAFLDYLQLTRKTAIPLLGIIYQSLPEPRLKTRAAEIIKQIGPDYPSDMIEIASEEKPGLTNIIIEALSSTQDERAANDLAHFIRFHNPSIRKSVIQALGKYGSETAAKILAAFLSDEREEIRCLALDNLARRPGSPVPKTVTEAVRKNHFHKKNAHEKFHYCLCLARAEDSESMDSIRFLLDQTSWFSSSSKIETALACISALSSISSKTSLPILERYSHNGHKKVKAACKKALRQIKKQNES
jgi:hypothetical protein